MTALYSLLSEDLESHGMAGSYRVLGFTTEAILQRATELCEILQFEFIFTKPCQQLETTIEEAIMKLKYKEILLCKEVRIYINCKGSFINYVRMILAIFDPPPQPPCKGK